MEPTIKAKELLHVITQHIGTNVVPRFSKVQGVWIFGIYGEKTIYDMIREFPDTHVCSIATISPRLLSGGLAIMAL